MEKIYHSFYGVVVETGEAPENPSVNEQNPEEGEGSEAPSGDNETPVIDPVENPEEDPAEEPNIENGDEEDPQLSLFTVEGENVVQSIADQVTFTIDGNAENAEGVKATVSDKKANDDGSYQFTVMPAAGYQVAMTDGVTCTYTDDSNEQQTVTATASGNTYTISASDVATIDSHALAIAITTEAVKNNVMFSWKSSTTVTSLADVFTNAKYNLTTAQDTIGSEQNIDWTGEATPKATVENTLTVKFTLAEGYTAAATRRNENQQESEAVAVEAQNVSGQDYVYEFKNITETVRLTFTATKTATTNTVTVSLPEAGVQKVTYTTDGTDPTADSTEITPESNTVELAENATLKLYVAPAEHYAVTVKKDDKEVRPQSNVYAISGIKRATTIAITAEQTEYHVTTETKQASGYNGDINSINVDFSANTAANWKTDADGKGGYVKKGKPLSFKIDGVDPAQRYELVFTGNVAVGEPGSDGTYLIPSDLITSDFKITVEVRAAAQPAIKWDGTTNTQVEKVLYQESAGGEYTAELSNTDAKKVTEGKTFSFKVTTKTGYAVKQVTAKDAGNKPVTVTHTAGEDPVYSLTAGNTTEINLSIETELNMTEAYTLVLKMADGSDAGSATVTVTDGDETEADDSVLNGSLSTAEDGTVKISTLNSVITAAVAAGTHYELAETDAVKLEVEEGVTGHKLEAVQATPGSYKITLVQGKTVTLVVKTERKALETAKTISFNKTASHIELDVKEQTQKGADDKEVKIVYQDEEDENKYHLAAGAREIEFDLYADGPYKPAVTGSTYGEVISTASEKQDDGKVKYSYVLLADEITADDVFTIAEETEKNVVTIKFRDDYVDVTAKANAVAISQTGDVVDENNTDGNPTGYQIWTLNGAESVVKDTKLTVTVTAREHSGIEGVTVKEGDGEATAQEGFDVSKNFRTYTFTLSVEEKTEIVVDSYAFEWPKELQAVDNSKLTPVKGKALTYDVDYLGTYIGAKGIGAEENKQNLHITRVEIRDKNQNVIPETTPATDGQAAVENYTAIINNDNEASYGATVTLKGGKIVDGTYKLVLFSDSVGDGDPEEREAVTYTLNVPKKISQIEVNGKKDIVQAIDTEVATYTLKANGIKDFSAVKVEIKNKDGEETKEIVKDAKIQNNKLVVTTGTEVGETMLTFSIGGQPINVQTSGSEPADGVALKTTSLIRAVDDESNNLKASKAPEVKCVSATDISLGLQLTSKNITASKDIVLAQDCDLYYEVKATPVGYDNTNNANLEPNEVTKYVKRTGDSQTEDIKVAKSNIVLGQAGGKPCQYKVSVKLVHTKEALAEGATSVAAENNLGESPATVSKDSDKTFTTKTAAYETSLKLKKEKSASGVFTGQDDVLVATAQFSKDTTFRSLKAARDITPGLTGGQKLEASVAGDKVFVDASSLKEEYGVTGKHKIEVIAQSAQNTTEGNSGDVYAARTVLDVTVVRGINYLKIETPSTTIYKAPKKAATLKTNLVLNKDLNQDPNEVIDKDEAPKSKKVKYTLEATGYEESDVLNLKGGTVKVDKSGKVTVDKDYQVIGSAVDNSFSVKVYPDDYEGNDVWNTCEYQTETITITANMLTIGDAVILQNDTDNSRWDNLTSAAESGDGIQASELNGAYLYAVADGLPERDSYDYETINNYNIAKDIVFKSSNVKAVKIDSTTGQIEVLKPAKGVTLTVTTTDGGADKKLNQKQVKVNVVYDQTGELGLKIEKETINNKPFMKYGVPADRIVNFNDADSAVFMVQLQHKNEDGDWEDAPVFTDYKIAAASGAKILNENKEAQVALVLVSKSGAKVKLTNNDKNNKSTVEYTFINEGLAAVDKVSAPKAALTYETGKALKTHTNETQKAVLTLTNTNKNVPEFLDQDNLYVLVEPDQAKVTAKNQDAIEKLNAQMSPNGLTRMTWNHQIELTFETKMAGYFDLPAGSYDLKVAVGKINAEGEFVPVAKPTKVTLKAAKAKAVSFKPTASYTVSAKDGAAVALTGKGNYDKVTFSNLQNDNVSDKEKGKANNFKNYFELEGNTLKLKAACYEDGKQLAEIIKKKDLTGYVFYEAYYSDDPNNKVTGSAKITVKIKDIDKKYAISNASAVNQNNATANVTVTANKESVAIAYAVIDSTGKNADSSAKWAIDATAGAWVTSAGNSSTIPLKMAVAAEKDSSVKVDLRVIPKDSFYAAKVAALSGNEAEAKKLIQTYGIPLTTTVTLKSAEKATRRIVFNEKSMKYVFVDYDAAAGEYVIDAPYTETYKGACSQINTITVTAKKDDVKALVEGDTPALTFENVAADGYMGTRLSVHMNKSKFMEEVAKDTQNKLYYKSDAKKGMIPQTLDFAVEVTYKDAPKDKVTDKFTFKLTMPTYPKHVAEDGKTDFTVTTDFLKTDAEMQAVVAEVQRRIKVNYDNFKYTYDEDPDHVWDETNIKRVVNEELIDVIKNRVGEDSGIKFDDTTPSATPGAFTKNTSVEAGSYAVTLNFTDGKQETPQTTTVAYTIPLAATGTKVGDVTTAVGVFLSDDEDGYKATNNSTKEDFLKGLREYVQNSLTGVDISNIRFALEENGANPAWSIEKATEQGTGTLKACVKIWDVDYNDWQNENGNEDYVSGTVTIVQLQTAADVIAAVKEAVGIDGTQATANLAKIVESNNGEKAKAAVLAAAEKAIGANPYKAAFAKEDDWKFISATKTEAGTISFTLTVTKEDGTALADNAGVLKLNVPETGDPTANIPAIPDLMTADEARTEVTTWIRDNTLDKSEDPSDTTITKVLKNDVTEDAIINAITNDTDGVVKKASLVTVTFEKKEGSDESTFDLRKATEEKEGYVKGYISLEAYDGTKTVGLDAVIPKIPAKTQTLAEAKTAAETKLDAHIAANPFTNADIATDKIGATKQTIITEVTGTDGVDSSVFDVTIEDSNFATQAATVNATGKITVTVTITNKTSASEKDTVGPKDYTIAELDQTEAEAAALIKAEVEKTEKVATYGIKNSTTDGDASVKAAILAVANGEIEGVKKNTFTVTASEVTGETLTLKDKEGATDTKTVTITLIVKKTAETTSEGTKCNISFDVTPTE